ncbi:MAG: T9SS type A sorting domain-containing protein [Bacteroidia bacterium]|nr:T9SS type A sorting domain-containing protein [Bacteroidia bacterium]
MKFFNFLIVCFALPLAAQSPELQVFATTSGHTCTWSVKNTGSTAVKITNASLRLFYSHPSISIYPNSIGQPTISRQSKGKFTGNTKTFNYKTYLLFSLDSLLDVGNSVNLVTVDNASQIADTIIIAGVDIFYSENAQTLTVNAYPPNETPCPAEYLFIDAGRANSGIKTLGFANTTLHQDNCINVTAIVFDGTTLERKAVSAVMPNCSNGKLWTTYGYSKDSQIYYTFDITNATHALQFDTLVKNMSTGDYLAFATQSIQDFSNFSQINSSLSLLGYNETMPTSNPGYFAMLGRKGANAGEAKFDSCTDAHLNCTISMEQSMLANAPIGKIPSFGSCFEKLIQILEKEPAQSVSAIDKNIFNLYPNPASDKWLIEHTHTLSHIVLYDATGRLLNTFPGNTKEISCQSLKDGIYFVSAITEDGVTITKIVGKN